MTSSAPRCFAPRLSGWALRDLLTVESMTDSAPVESVGFHLQQASEKALKAWLALLGETYPLTHNLATLLGMLSDCQMDIGAYERVTDLTRFAVEFRYEAASDAEVEQLASIRATVLALVGEVRQLLDSHGSD